MPRNLKGKLAGASLKDPATAMRVVIGALLALNLAAAFFAFKPFGGSADDLRREQSEKLAQVSQLNQRIRTATSLAKKVESARVEGDQFLTRYVVDRRTMSSSIGEELNRMAKEAGIRPLPAQTAVEPIEGSETLSMATITAGYEGSYANLKKFMELVDKSPRFLIIENMNVASPQGQQQQPQQAGQVVNVSLRLDAFVRETSGAGL